MSTPAKHPLDLLTEAELTLASSILKIQKNLGKYHRFPLLQLNEPSKQAMIVTDEIHMLDIFKTR